MVAATLLALVNCEQMEVTTVSAARVELQPQNASVAVSESARLTAVVLSDDGKTLTGRTVEWTSLQPNVAAVDNSGMVRGMTTGQATIRALSGAAAGTATITVTAAPAISLSLSDITFSAVQNGAAPGERTVAITNGGTGTLSGLTATVRYATGQPTAWLTASLATTSAPTALIFAADQRNFTPGTYTATVDITSSAPGITTRSITVRLTVLPPAPAIGLGANAIAFSATQGGADPAQQQVGVTNAGGGSLTGLATSIVYQTGQPTDWLSATLSGADAPAQLTLKPGTSGLPAGNYTADVRVTSALAQNSPQTVTVNFAVASVQNTIALSQNTIHYLAARGGGNPLSQTVQITSANSTQLTGLTFTIGYGAGQPTGWASASLSATTSPANLTVNAATGSLPTGIYSATLAVASPDASNSPQTIEVAFNVVDPVNPPANLSATAVSSAQIDLAWTPPASGASRYRIERKTGAAGTYATIDSTTATSYQSVGLSPATQYFYRVAACNGLSCSSPSTEANATTFSSVSTAPAGLGATPVSATQVNLSWTAASGTILTYRIERQDPGGSFVEIGQVPDSTLTFSSTGLSGGTPYSYQVRACNQGGCSAYSNTATALTFPDVPANLTASVVSSSQIDLSWSAVTGASNYVIERQISGGSFQQIATVTGTTHSDTGLTGGTQYSYQVKACNATGCSAFSAPVAAPPTPGAPGVPANLQANPVSPNQIDLTWSASTGGVTTYEIERRFGNNGTFGPLATVGAGTTAYSDLTPAADSQYGYQVRACSGATCSAYSNAVNVKTPKLPKPGTPGSLTATAVSPSQINLAWSPGSGSTAWHIIERSAPGVSFTQIDSIPGTATSYSNTLLTDSTTYTYRISACNSAGCSGHSNSASAMTPLAIPGIPQNLAAASAGSGTLQINLSWSAAAGRVARYEIEAHRLLQPYAPLAIVLPPSLTYRHTGLSPLSIWTYRVRACNSAGCSAYSNESTAFGQ